MGLLDQKLRGLLDYIQANTPRNTRQQVSPGTVIDQGLINPNQYNAPAANRFKDSALGLGGIIPGVGDYASGVQAADFYNRGETGNAVLAGLGALPLIPAIGGMFIGKGAKTWDALKAQQAEELLAKGTDPREVWKQTGTMRGVDKALRQEIPDNAAAIKGLTYQGREGVEGNGELANFLDHQGILDAYPDAGKIQSSLSQTTKGPEFGSYSNDGPAYNEFFPQLQASAKDVKSPVLHELQHAIQQREGWARGGSPEAFQHQYLRARGLDNMMSDRAKELFGKPLTKVDDDIMRQLQSEQIPLEQWDAEIKRRVDSVLLGDKEYAAMADELNTLGRDAFIPSNDAYRRLAGEAEARLTQSRMGLDAAQRLEHYPYDAGPYGFDVPPEQQIVRGLLDGPALSYADEAAQKNAGLLGAVDNAPVKPSADVREFADTVKQKYGLKAFDVYENNAGNLKLQMFEVPKESRKQGIGTKAMQELTDYADASGKKLTLSPGLPDDRHGTTSRARLVKFYKKFGFVENKGRNKDFEISEGMIREPKK